MRSVYGFCADGFEEVEGLTAVDLLRRAGVSVTMVSIMGRTKITGARNISVNTDILIEDIKEEITSYRMEGDSIGGIVECAIVGLEAGIGNPFFDSLESTIAHLAFSVPAVFSEILQAPEAVL